MEVHSTELQTDSVPDIEGRDIATREKRETLRKALGLAPAGFAVASQCEPRVPEPTAAELARLTRVDL